MQPRGEGTSNLCATTSPFRILSTPEAGWQPRRAEPPTRNQVNARRSGRLRDPCAIVEFGVSPSSIIPDAARNTFRAHPHENANQDG
jgi:hypothetical protein